MNGKILLYGIAAAALGVCLWFTFFRFTQLSEVPGGFFVDESSIAYNAATILHTGTDEFGSKFPLYFKAFGDYKNPLFIYSVAPLLGIFGNNVTSVRLAAAIWGFVALIIFVLWLSKAGFTKTSTIFAATVLITSPWLVQLSRVAFEVATAPFFIFTAVAVYDYLARKKAVPERSQWLWLSVFSLTLSLAFYAYTSMRMVAPLMFLVGILLLRRHYHWKKLLASVALFSLVLMPLLVSTSVAHGALTARYSVVGLSYFSENVLDFIGKFASNYIHHYSPEFLWQGGDSNLRHVPTPYGVMLTGSIPLLLVGAYSLYRSRKTIFTQWLVAALLISPVPSALTIHSPHVLRAVTFISLLFVVIALGIKESFRFKGWMWLITPLSIMALLLQAVPFLHFYKTEYVATSGVAFEAPTVKAIEVAATHDGPYYLSNKLYPGTYITAFFFLSHKLSGTISLNEVDVVTLKKFDSGIYVLDGTECDYAIEMTGAEVVFRKNFKCVLKVTPEISREFLKLSSGEAATFE